MARSGASRDGAAGTDQLVIPNGRDNEATRVNALADLEVTKTAPASVNAGSQFTYTIEVVNLGPSSASNVAITDTLPLPLPGGTGRLGPSHAGRASQLPGSPDCDRPARTTRPTSVAAACLPWLQPGD